MGARFGRLSGRRVTLAPIGTGRSAYGRDHESVHGLAATADGLWHIGTWLTLQPPGASLADLNELLRLHHRPDDETKFNEQFAIGIDQRGH